MKLAKQGYIPWNADTTHVVIDLLTNTEITFTKITANEVLAPLGINLKGLSWARCYNKDGVYKQRYKLLRL